MSNHEHVRTEPAAPAPVDDRGSATGFAIAKYGFIFLIVLAILIFLAVYLIPKITG